MPVWGHQLQRVFISLILKGSDAHPVTAGSPPLWVAGTPPPLTKCSSDLSMTLTALHIWGDQQEQAAGGRNGTSES